MSEGHPCFVANSGRIGFDIEDYHRYAPDAGASLPAGCSASTGRVVDDGTPAADSSLRWHSRIFFTGNVVDVLTPKTIGRGPSSSSFGFLCHHRLVIAPCAVAWFRVLPAGVDADLLHPTARVVPNQIGLGHRQVVCRRRRNSRQSTHQPASWGTRVALRSKWTVQANMLDATGKRRRRRAAY